MRYTRVAGELKSRTVYEYESMLDYVWDRKESSEDYYGLVDKTKLCYYDKEVGKVVWGKNGDNTVTWFINDEKKPIKLLKPKKEVVVETPKWVEKKIDITEMVDNTPLVDIEDIIKEIRTLKIEVEGA